MYNKLGWQHFTRTSYLNFQKCGIYQKVQCRKNSYFIKSDIELHENTLTGRLLTYLNNNSSTTLSSKPNVLLDSTKLQTINLKHGNIEHIKRAMQLLDFNDVNKYNLFGEIDKAIHPQVKLLATQDIFELLHLYMLKVPNKILNFDFYNFAMKELSRRMNFMTKSDIIRFLFYAGLSKKRSRYHELVRKSISYLINSHFHSLSAEDMCIICNSTFKTGTKIKTDGLTSVIITYLYNHLELLKDPAFFITFLKTIRQNRCQDEELMTTLTNTIFFNKTIECYSFAALNHILAVYSDYLYYDKNILEVFTEKCLIMLNSSEFVSKKEHMVSNIRLKDIKRFLWCLSNLNYRLDTVDVKNVLIPNILKRVESGDVEDDHSSILEITLYLWMLNYRAYELLPYFLNKEHIEHINTLNTPVKQRSSLLLSCIFYEENNLLKELGIAPELLPYNMSKQLEKRPILQNLTAHLDEMSAAKFELSCQIPCLNIVGITGHKKNMSNSVNIEVLDEYTTLKNTSNIPTGLMQLKLRLMDQSPEATILVESSEIENLNDDEVKQLLAEEIEFVC